MKLIRLLSTILLSVSLNATANNAAPWVGKTLEGSPCNGGNQGFGPFDYTSAEQRGAKNGGGTTITNLSIVEDRHFTADVENLIKGETSSTPTGDLNYTLMAWPNHHKALLSIIRYQLNIRNGLISDKLQPPPECYLLRAIHFSPNDAFSYSLYGYYLQKIGQRETADNYYKQAMKLAPNNAKISYTYSLLLIDLKRYDEAVKYAKIAYQDSRTPMGLKQKLLKLNMWRESEPTSENDSAVFSTNPAN